MRRRGTLERNLRAALLRWSGGVGALGGLLVAAAPFVALRGGGAVLALALALLGALVLALGTRLAARRIARRLLVPLAALAEGVRRITPDQPGERIHLASDALELARLE